MIERNLVEELSTLAIEELSDDELNSYRYDLGKYCNDKESCGGSASEARKLLARIVKEQNRRGTVNLPKPPYL